MRKKQTKKFKFNKINFIFALLALILFFKVLRIIPYYGHRGFDIFLLPGYFLLTLLTVLMILFNLLYAIFKRSWKNTGFVIFAFLIFLFLTNLPVTNLRKYFTQKVINAYYCDIPIKESEILGGVWVFENKHFVWDNSFCLGPICDEQLESYYCNR